MRLVESGRALAGASVIYAAMAACSASSDGPSPGQPFGGTGGSGGASAGGYGGATGMGGAVDSGLWDAVADALMDPVQDAAADHNSSGSRLKARRLVGSDGSSQFVGWHDQQRGEDCSPLPAEDGRTRCLPAAPLASGLFSDSACTNRLVRVDTTSCGSVPSLATWLVSGSCGEVTYVISNVSAFPHATGSVYARNGADCVEQINPCFATTDCAMHVANAKVAPSSFVEMTETIN